MIFEISLDDGHTDDLYAVELLEEYGLAEYLTLYIPTLQTKLSNQQIKYLAQKVTIGGHTVTHPMDMKICSDEQLVYEIVEGRKELQEITGQEVKSFCYPRGRYDDRVIEFVKKAGFTEGRTTDVLAIKEPKDIFKKGTTVHMFARKEYEGKDWLDVAKERFQKALEQDGYFHVWGHTWELSENKDWRKFEDLLAYLKEYVC